MDTGMHIKKNYKVYKNLNIVKYESQNKKSVLLSIKTNYIKNG
jgi:hypothetical protein